MTDESAEDHRVRPGRYRHFKGGQYLVLGLGRNTETGELLVVYRAVGTAPSDGLFWIRPERMFHETVAVAGLPTQRFEPDPIEPVTLGDGALPNIEQLLSRHDLDPTSMTAVQAILAAQRIEAYHILAAWNFGDSPDKLVATVRFLRLLDAADAEVAAATNISPAAQSSMTVHDPRRIPMPTTLLVDEKIPFPTEPPAPDFGPEEPDPSPSDWAEYFDMVYGG